MPIRNYYTFNGGVVAEYTPTVTGYRTYGKDALGSVIATYDNTGSLQNTYRYSPYGSTINSSTPAASPYFTWVGTRGYRVTNRPYADFYVRARHYSNALARWTTVDPLWPEQPAYVYAEGSPGSRSDPSGLGQPSCVCGSTPHVVGVSKKNKNYKCYLDVCTWYLSVCKPPLDDSSCSGWPSCNGINKSYPPCSPSNACYGECWRRGGNPTPGGGQPLPDWCCVECQIRVCCYVGCPLEKQLAKLLAMKFKKCH